MLRRRAQADGTVKVLDFGLAKAFQPDATDPSMSMSPTISLTAAATQMGIVSGTAAYMAPEQAEGEPVDKRADVWVFVAVLFEMLTGRKPFVGGDISDTPALVVKSEPKWDSLPADTPASVERLLRPCLARDPKLRLHAAQSNRAVRHAYGEGVPQAETEAAPRHAEGQGAAPKASDSACRLASDQGIAAAQFDLGVRYRDGQGVPRDDAEAVRWYRLAADQGNAGAQYNLGVMYANGEGVPQDGVEAHMWYDIAAVRSSSKDRDRWVRERDAIAERTTSDHVAEAQHRAREWEPTREPEPEQ